MVIDFHTHGKITSKFPFEEEGFLSKINEAKNEGIDHLALTEHCHADNFIEAYHYLYENYPYMDDCYDINGVKVYTGIEIGTKENLDVLVIANRDHILDLKSKIDNEAKECKYISIKELDNILDYNNMLVIFAHPYRKHEELPVISLNVLKNFDAIEFNATDLYIKGIEETKNKVTVLSKELNLPIVGGSDSHYFIQIGSIKNKFDMECKTITELKEQIKSNLYKVEISSDLSIRVRCAKIIKKLICK
jgi:histidinol phosphatase-like PHP family hydrolase